MKIVREVTLLSSGAFAESAEWKATRKSLYQAIREVDWPRGSGTFTIHPESGKKRGMGNGVTPIKNGLMTELVRQGWKTEQKLVLPEGRQPGKVDAILTTASGRVALEWETGNISSSHRALNKMVLGMQFSALKAGILVVPSRALYKFLTDRIGNMDELEPYVPFWKAFPLAEGVLEIVCIEHDAESVNVPRIPKGKDGRASE